MAVKSLGGGGGATAEQLAQIDSNQTNIGLLTLNQMILGNVVVKEYDQQAADQFEDETGVTTKTNMTYDAVNDRYGPTPAFTGELLIQMTGADESTDFTDATGKTITAEGGAQIDTSLGATGDPYGGSTPSLLLSSVGDALTTPDDADFVVGTGEWTWDAWIRPSSVSGVGYLFCFPAGDGAGGWTAVGRTGTNLFFAGTDDGTTLNYNVNTSGVTIAVNTWYHVQVVRSADTLQIYVDGVRRLNQSLSASFDIFDDTGNFTIGARDVNAAPAQTFLGHMHEVRFLKGTAEWTTTPQTPPTGAYDTDAPDITFVTDPFTATTAPTTADALIYIDPVTAVTLNTDIIVEVSRDNGTTWETSTLSYDFDYDSDYQIWRAQDIDLSGQPSGTQLALRMTSANGTDFYFKGWLLQWQ